MLTMLLVLSTGVLLVIAWMQRKGKQVLRLAVRDWIVLQVSSSTCLLLCITGVVWHLHREAGEWRRAELEGGRSHYQARPSSMGAGEYFCARGIQAYRAEEYDDALEYFSHVQKPLPDRLEARKQFYEAMCHFRMAQARKIAFDDPPTPEQAEHICERFRALIPHCNDRRLRGDAMYWYAQSLRFLRKDNEAALKVFDAIREEFRGDYELRWLEGTLYYTAVICLERGDEESFRTGVSLLQELSHNHFGRIQPIELGSRGAQSIDFMVEHLSHKYGIDDLVVLPPAREE